MPRHVQVYEFAETAFVVGSDPVVCIVPVAIMRRYMTVAEIDEAFSGYASYRQGPWMKRYVESGAARSASASVVSCGSVALS